MTRSTWLLLFYLLFSTSLAIVNGQCRTIRVSQAVHQPSLNGYYHMMDEQCDKHDVWQQNLNPTTTTHLYIVYGTKSGAPGWVIVNEFCSLDSDELAVISEPYAYPYDTLTYGQWYELTTNATWSQSKLLLTCVSQVHKDDIIYYDTYYHDDSLSGAAIFGIVFGCVLACILICALVVFFVRRRRVYVARTAHVYHSSPVGNVAVTSGPSTTVLVGAAPVSSYAVIGPSVYYPPCTSRVVVQPTRNVSVQSRPVSVQSRPNYSKVSTRR